MTKLSILDVFGSAGLSSKTPRFDFYSSSECASQEYMGEFSVPNNILLISYLKFTNKNINI